MRARGHVVCCLALAALLAFATPAAQAGFGIAPGSFSVTAENEDGTLDTLAGSHPYEYTVSFALNQNSEGEPEGALRDLIVELPPGLLGDPQALPRCGRADFDFGITPACPGNSQIGVADVQISVGAKSSITFHTPVYNLSPTPGQAATIGLSLDNHNSLQDASLRSSSDYGVRISDLTVPTGVGLLSVSETIWGLPMDKSHDPERICPNPLDKELAYTEGCESDAPPAPFLALPASCTGPLETTIAVDSLQGGSDSATVLSLDEAEEPVGLDGCNQLEFEPSISSQPSTNLADSPSGLEFDLHQAQNEEPQGRATSPAKDVTVSLPVGMSLNPSAANGLEACSEKEVGFLAEAEGIHFSEEPQSCPDGSKIGTVEASSPLLDHPVKGAVYVAKPFQNPFGSLLAIYLALEDKKTGIVAKLGGEVQPDPNTGQLTTTFLENPQLPIEDVELHIFNGARAALRTPLTCGEHTTTSQLTPWSSPEGEDESPEDSFQITASPSGGCPATEAEAPNSPSFSAGTVEPVAGAFSPFVLKLSREDGSKELSRLDVKLPPGLSGKLAGVAECPETAIEQAKSREEPEMGRAEQQSPSCPASSEVGTVTVGAGAGTTPFYATGHAYLAGPYAGAPLSLVIVTPAVAGPFDLGAVVVRTALAVDPETAQITARSDAIPTILEGIPLDVRTIAIHLARKDFTLNPTSCEAMAIDGTAFASGSEASLSNRFQVGGCNALPFKPNLTLSLKGKTKRGRFPALKATLRMNPGEANIASAQVTLPHAEFIANAHIGSPCTRVQYAAKECPANSVLGTARAVTPLLEAPLEGPVYLMSGFGHLLPDVAVDFHGQVNVFVHSKVDKGRSGGLRNSFQLVPDAPVSEFTLQLFGGKRGLLENSEDVCAKPQRATLAFTAHSGRTFTAKPKIKVACKGQGRKAHKHRAKR